MDTKRTIAERIHTIVPELDQEQIVNLLEVPKNSDMGDLAFPAFSLARILRKAPQMIAADIAEILGTVAGADTLLVICKDEETAKAFESILSIGL